MKKYLLSLNLNFNLFLGFVFLFALKSFGQVTHTTLAVPAGNIAPGTDNNVLYCLKIENAASIPFVPNSISFNASGTYSYNDLKFNPSSPPIKIYQSSSNIFSVTTSTLIGSTEPNGDPSESINVLNLPLNSATGINNMSQPESYIFITLDISNSPSSTIGNTFKINGQSSSVLLTYSGTTPIITNNQTDAAGVQTIGTPPPVLIANYTFCGNANDGIGVNNGVVNGATLSKDRFDNDNSAYTFDGVDDYISTSALATNQTDNWTMSAWVKPNSLNQFGSILLNGYDDGSSGNGYSMIISDGGFGTGNTLAGLNCGVAIYSSEGTFGSTTNWYQMVMTRSEGVTKFYINGVQTAGTSTNGVNDFNSNSSFRIGSQNGNRFFSGAIDDVKVYDSAFTSSQVLDAYNNESANVILACSPVACPTITVSTDSNIPNGCDGTATFSATGGMANYTFASLSGGTFTGNSFTAKAGTYTIQATDANGCTGTLEVVLTNNDTVAPTLLCPENIYETADANCTKVVTWPALDVNENCLGADPVGYEKLGVFNGHTYYFKDSRNDWASSKAEAESRGGRLLEINSAEEQAFIQTFGKNSFLGINDSETEGQFVYNSGGPISYMNWRLNEPDGGTNENVTLMRGFDGKWETLPSYLGEPYIMEMDFGYTITKTTGLASGSAFPIGITNNTFEVTDAAGNKSTCSFTVTINPSVTADISYTSAAICSNSGEKTVILVGPAGGSYSVSPVSGLIVNSSTGTINTLNAVEGDYTIVYTIDASGSCPAITDNFAITVNAAPAITCPQNISVCKNEAVFNLPNIPEGATVSVGGVTNSTGTFDPSADWSAFPTGVPVIYTLTNESGCISTCTFTVMVKRLPNSGTSVYFTTDGLTELSVCKNSEDVQLRFDGGTGSMEPFTYYYTINNGDELIAEPGTNTHLSLSTALAGSFAYKLTKVKIGNGCELVLNKTATLTVNDLPATPSYSIIQPTCLVGTGSVTINTLADAYSLDDGENFQAQNSKSLSPGTYLLKIKDAKGCISLGAEVVIEQQPGTPDAPTVSVVHPTCTVATGLATITNPVEGYNYFLDGNAFQNASSTTVNAATTYNITATNIDGCQSAPTEIVVNAQPATPLDPEPTVTQPTCSLATGTISMDGLTGFTYSFGGSFGANNSSEPLAPGDYLVKIKSDEGCESADVLVTIDPQPTSPAVPTLTQTPANCSSSTGSISVNTGMGQSNIIPAPTLMYKLDNSDYQTETIFNAVSTGSHTVTVKNDDGCTAFATIVVESDLQAPTVNVPANLSVCKDSPAITLSGATPTGGLYTGTGVSAGIFTPNTVGNFTITYSVTGSNECVGSNSFTINVTPKFSVAVQPTAGSYTVCEGTANAGFQFVANGISSGASGFSVKYKLDEDGAIQTVSTTNGIAVVNVDASIPGIYTYYLLDSYDESNCGSGSFGTLTFTVNAKPEITCPQNIAKTTNDPIVILGSTGTYSGTGVSLNGSNYEFNPAAAGVGVHEIAYTITGENGCANTCTFTISVTGVSPCNVTLASFTTETVCQPFPIPLTFTGLVPNSTNSIILGVSEVLIPGNAYNDQIITVTANASGVASTTLDVSGYQTVEYKLTVKEVKIGDCILNPTTAITANFTKKPRGGGQAVDITETAICNGGGTLNGVLGTVANANYNTNFTYQIWNLTTNMMVANGTGIATPLAASTLQFNIPSVVLPAGNYEFRIVSQDIDGCGITAEIKDNFTVLPTPTLTATAAIINLDCNNSIGMGAIDQTISGGSGTYTFLWSNNATTEDITGLVADNYSVTITDPTSCGSPTLVKNYTVTKPNSIVVNATSITTQCNGNNGTASLSATGGNGGFSFTSNNGGTVDIATFAGTAGTYIITATDSKGCTGTLILTISNCEDSDVICTTTQNGYGNAQFTACQPDGSSLSVGTLMANALNGSSYVFGLQANNRTFAFSPSDLSSNIYSMLSGVSNASSKFGLGGASYSVGSSWSKVPLTNTGKIANNLFAHSMALFFNLQNSTKLDQVALNNPILNTESTLNCGSETGSGVVSSYQLPTGVVTFLNNPANGYAATVAGLFQLNNDALGGKAGLPNLSTLAAAADKVNKAFNGCRLLASLPANTATFGTNISVNEGNKAFDAPAKGGLYMTLIEGNPATGHILGVVEVGSNGLSGFAPVITNNYYVIMGTDPEGSRSSQAPAGYRIVSQIVSNGTAGFTGQGAQRGSGEVAIGTYNPQAGSRIAAAGSYQITFVLEPSAPLPVRLISFTGKSTEKGNELNWKTSSEQNFSHYEVERSSDAKTFEKIGMVNGLNSEYYEFTNHKPQIANKTQLYYRLKLVDLDGKSDYSKIIYINSEAEIEINVYPNPATDFINIENLDGKELNFRVLDELGREIIGQTKSNEMNVKIPIVNISTGTYFIQIQNQNQIIYRKVIVNK